MEAATLAPLRTVCDLCEARSSAPAGTTCRTCATGTMRRPEELPLLRAQRRAARAQQLCR